MQMNGPRVPEDGRAAGRAVELSRTAEAFRLGASNVVRVGRGIRAELPHGALPTLAERVRRFFAGCAEGPDVLVGALPFDRDGSDHLFQPVTFREEAAPPAGALPHIAEQGGRWTVSGRPTVAGYRDAVRDCLGLLARSRGEAQPLRKVVLSRSLTVSSSVPIDPARLVAVLGRDPSITSFATVLPGGTPAAPRMLVGATPELLVSKAGAAVVSHPLAGSARRSGDAARDREAAAGLQRSAKDRFEHQAVVEAVLDALSPYCRTLGAPEGTTLRSTATMWHLGTRICGTLKDPGMPVTELVAALHPTPAVCGLPRERAACVIRDLEGYDRGFYAGAVGYVDRAGDGEWYVSIRSADIVGQRVTLYAGAGIVEGSDPAAEAAETSAKFAALLGALGIDEHGRPIREYAA
jgi:isochorismate synthase